MMRRLQRLLTIGAFVVCLDQITKLLIIRLLAVGASFQVLPGYLDIVHVRNRGAAFGLFADHPEAFTVPFFYVTSVFALGLLFLYYLSLKPEQGLSRAAVSLIFGGAVGNLIDRMARGTVVDFVSAHIGDRWADFVVWGHRFVFKLEWPAFNVADSAITISVVWLLAASVWGASRSFGKIQNP